MYQQVYACGCKKLFDEKPSDNLMCDKHSEDAVTTRPYRERKAPSKSAAHVYMVLLAKLRINYGNGTETSTDPDTLSERYGVAKEIVSKALDKLEKERIIVSIGE